MAGPRTGAARTSSRPQTGSGSRWTPAESERPHTGRRQTPEEHRPPPAPPGPPTGTDALASHFDHLSDFERSEILGYNEVYFIGQGSDKLPSTSAVTENNHGFDDERGDYSVVHGDHIGYRYEVTGLLGKGSFGQVVRAFDHKKQMSVAVKIIRNKQRFHKQVRAWPPRAARQRACVGAHAR